MPQLRDSDAAVRDATCPQGNQVARYRLQGVNALYLYVRPNGARDWYVRYTSPTTGKDIARHLARAVWRFDPSETTDDRPLGQICSSLSITTVWSIPSLTFALSSSPMPRI